MRTLVAVLVAAAAVAILPSSASAKDCSATKPFIFGGDSWVVYTAVQPGRKDTSCEKARKLARATLSGRKSKGWKCSKKTQACTRGGTYENEYGFTMPRYLVGWHHAD